ncbi:MULTISPECIES: hypothetical protein [Haloprofundus]|uniref:hypothetical protein n=1 Tax=Haloprofundus TaxID=1911573 RepID=UPI000E44572A|nr:MULTISPECIES: hypothetical protein [Haloprofundus]QCJ47711.1 hypothetical protein FCF25_11525 [Haloprofundus sp. MHR1]
MSGDSAETLDRTTSTVDLAVRDIVSTPTLVIPNSPDSIGTYGESDEQFVVAAVAGLGRSSARHESVELAGGGATYQPAELGEITNREYLWANGTRFRASAEETVLFTVPKPIEANEATVQWPGGSHVLNEDTVRKLGRPPTEFEVTEFFTPKSVPSGETVTVTLVVENVGDVSGTFIGALNRSGPSVAYTPVTSIALELKSAESATWTYSYTPYADPSDEEATMNFTMDWRGGHLSSEITVKPDG